MRYPESQPAWGRAAAPHGRGMGGSERIKARDVLGARTCTAKEGRHALPVRHPAAGGRSPLWRSGRWEMKAGKVDRQAACTGMLRGTFQPSSDERQGRRDHGGVLEGSGWHPEL